MARNDKDERRRFDRAKDDKVWSKEERETYEARRAALAPIIRDLTTPPPSKKKKGLFEELGL
jgi:hypothetical protein